MCRRVCPHHPRQHKTRERLPPLTTLANGTIAATVDAVTDEGESLRELEREAI